jgi:hypothetical protein
LAEGASQVPLEEQRMVLEYRNGATLHLNTILKSYSKPGKRVFCEVGIETNGRVAELFGVCGTVCGVMTERGNN